MDREVKEIASRSEWLRWRSGHVTASRIAALFDRHPYLTREALAGELFGVSQGDSPAMRRGRILEPAVIAALAEDNPSWRLTKASTYHYIPSLRLGATPDVWLDNDALIQIGTMSPEEWDKGHGRAPFYKILQTATELMVTDRARGVLAIMVCSPSYPVHLFDVPRHEQAERRIVDAVTDWWRSWDAGEVPVAKSTDNLAEMLDDGTHKDLSGDNLLPSLLEERAVLKNDEKATKARLDVIDYEIKNRIGAARTGWLPGWLIKFPTVHTKGYTVAAKDSRRLMITHTEE